MNSYIISSMNSIRPGSSPLRASYREQTINYYQLQESLAIGFRDSFGLILYIYIIYIFIYILFINGGAENGMWFVPMLRVPSHKPTNRACLSMIGMEEVHAYDCLSSTSQCFA